MDGEPFVEAPGERRARGWPGGRWTFLSGLLFAVTLAAIAMALRSPHQHRHPPLPRALPDEVLGEIVRRHSRTFGLDEILVLRVIFVESGGDPRARSRDGAVGLMQLLPRTAAARAEELGLKGHSLEDPDDNVMLGCYHLSRMLVAFNGDPHLAVAAYHAGAPTVRKWRRNSPRGAVGADILRNHGYPSTRKHVSEVLKGYVPRPE